MIQTAKIIGQLEREHRNYAVCQVHTVSASVSFLIKEHSLFHVPGYVGNMNAHFKMTVFLADTVYRIIKVLGIWSVDGNDRKIPEIRYAIFRNDFTRQRIGFLHEFIGEYMRQPVLGNDDIDIKALVPFITDNFRDMALCIRPFPRPFRYFNDDPCASCCFHFLAFRNFNDHIDLFIDRHSLSAVFQHFIRAYKRIICSFNDTGNAAFRIMPSGLALDCLHFDFVIINSVQMIIFPDIYVFMVIICNEKTKTRTVCLINPLKRYAWLIN